MANDMNDNPNGNSDEQSAQNHGLAARLSALPRDFLLCVMFFTRLPLRMNIDGPTSMRITAHMYPMVGVVVGSFGALILAVGAPFGLPPMATAILAIFAMIMTTGALHEDGLADMADGFGGGYGQQRKLEIMKDSRIGTYGVLALVLSQLLRVILLAELVIAGVGIAVTALIAASVVSRAASMLLWKLLPPARADGLSKGAGQPDGTTIAIALLTTLIVLLVLLPWSAGLVAICIALIVSLVVVLAFTVLCQKQIQGQTGDTIGAAQQICELVFMAALLISFLP